MPGKRQRSPERERQRIAHDLHDGLGQLLGGIALKTQALSEALAEKALPEAADANAITQLVNEALQQTRLLVRGLDPSLGRAEALSDMLVKLAANTEKLLRIVCTFQGEPSCGVEPLELTQQLFRIAQEAINNAVRHGRATRVAIELSHGGRELTLLVRDNGSGLTPSGKPRSGIGFGIMAHRAKSIGGVCEIEPDAAGGTVVRCRAPLPLQFPG